jgi:hypothetical protein
MPKYAESARPPTLGQKTSPVLWWLCLCAAPLGLLAIELFHPAEFTKDPGMWPYLSEPQPADAAHHALGYFGPDWWFRLHMIQTPLVALVCVGLWLMTAGIDLETGPLAALAARLSRFATFVTLIYFTVLDGIGGIALGRQILVAQQMLADGRLTQAQMNGLTNFLNTMWVDPWVGGVGSFISLTASWAVFFGAALAAIALGLTRRAPLVPVILLAFGFGWQLQDSHAAMHGPIAFALLIIAAAWIWFRGAVRRGSAVPARLAWV